MKKANTIKIKREDFIYSEERDDYRMDDDWKMMGKYIITVVHVRSWGWVIELECDSYELI